VGAQDRYRDNASRIKERPNFIAMIATVGFLTHRANLLSRARARGWAVSEQDHLSAESGVVTLNEFTAKSR
jgi:hypothetical protein